MSTVLSTDKSLRKSQPMARGLLDYFPRALAAVSNVSFVANEQHNPGEPMHWAKEKSTDHADCIVRHMVDRGSVDDDGLRHSAKLAWRALALLETELEYEDAEVDQRIWEPRDEGGPINVFKAYAAATITHTIPYEPESTHLPPAPDLDACGTTDGTTPIEYRVNYPNDGPLHWLVRGGQVFFGTGANLAVSGRSVASIEAGLRDGTFVLCDKNGDNLPSTSSQPIEYRVNYASQARGTVSNLDRSHWIVRGDVVRFFDLAAGTETDECGGLDLDEIGRGLRSGSFVLCDETGTALPSTSSYGEDQ
jgi:hypothetical protein